MYRNMDEWSEIRRRVLVEGVSRRQILRETKMHWLTLKKILEHSQPPGYRQQMPRRKTKLGDYLKRMEEILKEDQAMPRKQRHTAKRIWERLREEGFTGGYTVVKDAVRGLTQRNQEVFVPLVHRPGEAQVDFGHALARVNGRLRKVVFFVMALPYSDASFVMVFERECTETFWEGHVRAFEFFQGVPRRISYDNTKVAVSQILGRARRLTQGFLQLKSHYLFDHHFCRVARGNEKGVVEGQVKFTRLNYFVPVPQVRDLAELNTHLGQRCAEDRQRRLRGQPGTKAELLVEDQKAFLPLPPTPFEACRKSLTKASSLSLVRLSQVCSEDSVRLAFKDTDEEACARWQQKALAQTWEPLLKQPWILDMDMTVKPIYGHQEGAQIGYNPHKPGRPSHALHTWFVRKLRLVLDVRSATWQAARSQTWSIAAVRDLAPGLTPRSVLEKFAAVQMIDVHLPTTDGRHIVLPRYTQPEPELKMLLQQLKLTLPEQSRPRITSAGKLAD